MVSPHQCTDSHKCEHNTRRDLFRTTINNPLGSLIRHKTFKLVDYPSTIQMVRFGGVPSKKGDVRFSNRPVGVKRFQTIHHCSVDVAHGLALLFEIGTGPFHHGIRGRGGTIFGAALPSADGRSKRTYELTSSIVPRGTSFHRSVELAFPPIGFDLVRSFMPLRLPGSSGTRCRQPRCGA